MKIENFNYCKENRTLFENVNFYFEDCSLNFILGAKKIGKTTILDQIASRRKSSNFISFPHFKQIAYLAQANEFQVSLTVKEIISFVQQLQKTLELILPKPISEILDFRFVDLNADERKLLLIYINLLVDKQLYLFDEPEVGLALDYSETIFGWIKELVELDKTVIVTTNKLDNISDIDNVNYIKGSQEVLSDNYLKIKSRMGF